MMAMFRTPASNEDEPGETFDAMYDGRCAWCDEFIDEGEPIYRSIDAGGFAHERHRDEEMAGQL